MTICRTNLILTLVFLITVIAATDAVAEGSVFGGLDLPSEGISIGGTDFGWAVGGYYTVPVSPKLDMGGTVTYNKFISTLADLPALEGLFDYDFKPWAIQILGQIDFFEVDTRAFRGFAGLGVASYNRIDEEGASRRQTKLAWQAGIAAKIEMAEFRLGYHWVDLGDLSATWFGLTLGVVF